MTIGGDILYTGGSDNTIQMWSIQDFTNVNCIKVSISHQGHCVNE